MDPGFQVLRILWVAFVGSHVVMGVVGPVFGEPSPDASAMPFVVSALPPLILLAASGRLLARMPAQPAWLVRFAACEAVAITGLGAHMVGAPTWAGVALAVVGLLAHLTTWPGEERVTRWEVDRLGADDRQQR